MTIQVKATSQYFSVALFTVLFNVVLSFWIRIFCMVGWGVQGGFDPKVLWVNLHRGHLYSKVPTFILLIENIKKLFPWKI